jgi:hypothetical protein
MQQEIDQPWRLVAAEQTAKQPTLLRPDATEARDRREQRIKQRRAYPFSFSGPVDSLPLDFGS